jgi:hypothetical protein
MIDSRHSLLSFGSISDFFQFCWVNVDEDEQVEETNQAIGTIITVMKAHSSNVGVQTYCCFAIMAFASQNGTYLSQMLSNFWKENRKILNSKGVFSILLEILKKHSGDSYCVTNACSAMLQLLNNGKNYILNCFILM